MLRGCRIDFLDLEIASSDPFDHKGHRFGSGVDRDLYIYTYYIIYIYLSIYPSIHPSIHPSNLSIYMYIPYIYIFIYLYLYIYICSTPVAGYGMPSYAILYDTMTALRHEWLFQSQLHGSS